MKPTINDVLSGRGAWFNQHPGNEHFRRMIEKQKDVYTTGTKKQKMDMANAIVESTYSMDPPGRFLKQCPETGQWSELSKRDAADRVAQAMAYAVRGKDKLKQRREERRRLRSSSSQQRSKDDVVEKSSQSADRSTKNNHLAGVRSSTVARHDVASAGTTNVESAGNDVCTDIVAHEMVLPDNSNLQQQLIQRLLQTNSNITLPSSSSLLGAPPNANQSGLVQVLARALQQQQQLLSPQYQYTLGQDPMGIQTLTPLQLALGTQAPLQPALLVGLTQLLNQTQQQQQQLQNEQEQLLLLRRLLNQQTVFPAASNPPTALSLSAPFLTGPQSPLGNSNLLQNQGHLQPNLSNALLLNVLSNLIRQPNANNLELSTAPRGAQQTGQLQMQQLVTPSLGSSSNSHLPFQQQQSLSFDTLLQQAALQLEQNSRGLPQPPINLAVLASASATADSTRQEGSDESVQSGPEDDLRSD